MQPTDAQLAQAFESGARAAVAGRDRNSPLYGMGEYGRLLQGRWNAGYDAQGRNTTTNTRKSK